MYKALLHLCPKSWFPDIGFFGLQYWATVYKHASLLGERSGEDKDGKKWAFMYILCVL